MLPDDRQPTPPRPPDEPTRDLTLRWALAVGFTLLLLFGLGLRGIWTDIEPAKRARAKADVEALDKACRTYREQHGWHAHDLGEVFPFLEHATALTDPWGNPYQYRPPADMGSPDPPLTFTISPKDGTRISNER